MERCIVEFEARGRDRTMTAPRGGFSHRGVSVSKSLISAASEMIAANPHRRRGWQRLAFAAALLAGGTSASAQPPDVTESAAATAPRLVRPVVRLAVAVDLPQAHQAANEATSQPVVVRVEPSSHSERWIPVRIDPAAAEQPEHRIGLRFGDERSGGDPSGRAKRPWLDIRPRTLPVDGSERLSDSKLPADVSGLDPAVPVPAAVQVYAVDLRADDIWRGASFGYQPLYFEDRLLERYGSIGRVLEYCPLVRSGAQFAFSSAALPISVLHSPPHRRVRSGDASRFEAIPAAERVAEAVVDKVTKLGKRR